MLSDYLDILIARLAIWSIRRVYEPSCQEYDEHCASCKAKEIIEWLEHHIKLIQW